MVLELMFAVGGVPLYSGLLRGADGGITVYLRRVQRCEGQIPWPIASPQTLQTPKLTAHKLPPSTTAKGDTSFENYRDMLDRILSDWCNQWARNPQSHMMSLQRRRPLPELSMSIITISYGHR